jgi:DNA modification methylase
MIYRTTDGAWPTSLVDGIHTGDAVSVLREIPDESIGLIVTSPPYWDVIDYQVEGQLGPGSYETFLGDLHSVWSEAARVLIPNGKLAINSPIMPIAKSVIGDQHTRHLKNIAYDIDFSILYGLESMGVKRATRISSLQRYGTFIWQKQTSKKMFGSYPYPPNIFEDNTVEFINVYVKDGPPPNIPPEAKLASRLSQEEWRNLSMQVWNMYPADVKRSGHPAPFPLALPLRLIRMFSFARSLEHSFPGDVVLDMFCGSGTTALAARALERPFIGIDLSPEYCDTARRRLATEAVDPSAILLESHRVRAPRSTKTVTLFEIDEHGDEALV